MFKACNAYEYLENVSHNPFIIFAARRAHEISKELRLRQLRISIDRHLSQVIEGQRAFESFRRDESHFVIARCRTAPL